MLLTSPNFFGPLFFSHAWYIIFCFIRFLQETCIVLPQKVKTVPPLMCPLARHIRLIEQKNFYKLTTPPKQPLAYPNETTNLLEAVRFPLLNQPFINVVLRSALLPELDEQKWVIRYLAMAQRNKVLAKKIGNGQTFTKYSDYAQLLKSYREEQPKSIISFQIPGVVSIFLRAYW